MGSCERVQHIVVPVFATGSHLVVTSCQLTRTRDFGRRELQELVIIFETRRALSGIFIFATQRGKVRKAKINVQLEIMVQLTER